MNHQSCFTYSYSFLLVFILFPLLASADEVWNVKCIDPEGHTMAVKAVQDGFTLPVKAVSGEKSEDLNVVALPSKGAQIPVCVLAQKEGQKYADVKAVTSTGDLLPVKAFTSRGETLSIKAIFNKKADRYDIKAIDEKLKTLLAVKAISPAGAFFDVKGIKQPNLADNVVAQVQAVPHSRGL